MSVFYFFLLLIADIIQTNAPMKLAKIATKTALFILITPYSNLTSCREFLPLTGVYVEVIHQSLFNKAASYTLPAIFWQCLLPSYLEVLHGQHIFLRQMAMFHSAPMILLPKAVNA
jgi:hypothetical protein